MTTSLLLAALFNFAFYYPIIMAFFWMIGGIYYYLRRERGTHRPSKPPPMASEPFVSILMLRFPHISSCEIKRLVGQA
ncbi:hypothetical protein TP38_21375, partial [Xanthomonas citri pv. citri]